MNRNIWFLLAFGVVGGAAFPAAVPAPATAESVTPAVAQATVALDPPVLSPGALAPRKEGEDMVMGLASAPVTLIEYASLTCPHCAHFNEATFPQLKSQYIDKGLVRYIFRDFPLDRMALMAAQIARCSGPERYFAFVDVLFRQQTTWTNGKDAPAVTANLKKLARQGGMTDAAVDACLADKAGQDAVLAQELKGEQDFKVNSTPTLIINGKAYPGALSIDELDTVLKPLVPKS